MKMLLSFVLAQHLTVPKHIKRRTLVLVISYGLNKAVSRVAEIANRFYFSEHYFLNVRTLPCSLIRNLKTQSRYNAHWTVKHSTRCMLPKGCYGNFQIFWMSPKKNCYSAQNSHMLFKSFPYFLLQVSHRHRPLHQQKMNTEPITASRHKQASIIISNNI